MKKIYISLIALTTFAINNLAAQDTSSDFRRRARSGTVGPEASLPGAAGKNSGTSKEAEHLAARNDSTKTEAELNAECLRDCKEGCGKLKKDFNRIPCYKKTACCCAIGCAAIICAEVKSLGFVKIYGYPYGSLSQKYY